MSEIGPAALFLVGLLGGAHCIGMCGGIVGALSLGSAPRLSLHNTSRVPLRKWSERTEAWMCSGCWCLQMMFASS